MLAATRPWALAQVNFVLGDPTVDSRLGDPEITGNRARPPASTTQRDRTTTKLRRIGLRHDSSSRSCRPPSHKPSPQTGDQIIRTDIKDTLKDALARSSLETWGSSRVGENQATASTGWLRSDPNSGQIATFKRYWGTSLDGGFVLWAKATLQLPPGFQFGSRVVFVLDVVEGTAGTDNRSSRLRLSLLQLHEFLHILATAAIDEIGRAVFPLVCEDTTPTILGPNHQINFGDRSLETCVEIPGSFERPQDAQNIPWVEINTPEDRDSRDQLVRDTVIREGIQKALRNNGYDRIENEIANLPVPS
jgi:hypothetical protein